MPKPHPLPLAPCTHERFKYQAQAQDRALGIPRATGIRPRHFVYECPRCRWFHVAPELEARGRCESGD